MEVLNMSKKLLIAEKPDVMRQLVAALDRKAVRNKFSDRVSYYEGEKFLFASALGHLFTPQMPQEISEDNKRWSNSRLADIPDELPLKPGPTDKNYYKCIKKLAGRNDVDEIIVCTDPDREGQLIWTLIATELKPKSSLRISRAWIQEWTPLGLRNAFNTRKPNSAYDTLSDAGLCRQRADYLIGLTSTRVMTVNFGGSGNIINTGRVQTPTAAIVWKNDQEIANFKPEPYNVLKATFATDEASSIELTSARIDEDVSAIASAMKGRSAVLSRTDKKTSKKAPLLYNTTDIQKDAGKKLGLSAERVMEILQDLYQVQGMTTYPRTEVRQVSADAAKNASRTVSTLRGLAFDEAVNGLAYIDAHGASMQKHVISTDGDMPHEAITPSAGGNPASKYASLPADEQAVYRMIVTRYLQAFYAPAVMAETEVSANVTANGKTYRLNAKGKSVIDPSWMELSGIPSDKVLPSVTDGNSYECLKAVSEAKKTTPPARLTEAGLLDAMEHAGRYVDDDDAKEILKDVKGIGTSATRSGIIENLYAHDYITRKKSVLYPTAKLNALMQIIGDQTIASPVMTSELEGRLSDVESGKMTKGDFIEMLDKNVDELIETANTKKAEAGESASISADDLGACPVCGKAITETKMAYSCPDRSCGFALWKQTGNKKITKSEAKKIIKQLDDAGVTEKIDGFVSKAGKPFSAKLKVNKSTHKIEFDFSKEYVGTCPVCGGRVEDRGVLYACENECGFKIWRTVSGKRLTDNQMMSLLERGYTPVIKGFTSKAGKKFDATLVLDDVRGVTFKFK